MVSKLTGQEMNQFLASLFVRCYQRRTGSRWANSRSTEGDRAPSEPSHKNIRETSLTVRAIRETTRLSFATCLAGPVRSMFSPRALGQGDEIRAPGRGRVGGAAVVDSVMNRYTYTTFCIQVF